VNCRSSHIVDAGLFPVQPESASRPGPGSFRSTRAWGATTRPGSPTGFPVRAPGETAAPSLISAVSVPPQFRV